jgi:hypothetical protein
MKSNNISTGSSDITTLLNTLYMNHKGVISQYNL